MAQQTMAQEKAVELFKKYYCLSNNSKSKLKVIEYETAKKCALIAVDEMLNHCSEGFKPFWRDVKEEINKL